ncbi:conserved hypothetical protein [Luminiphilus syltensis NOR5-1B]|uniref:DUF218 domain-containing protein n=1 Tax=Luminiphilus syltensis NOR5-1B TaxID=565045 RepID=B8KW70_9GAMM|nr:YdcF family protein [Luminiphilus syltensis]EED35058.1 conserved hypothetical protein [Luminiphilus syltensis NOR5-1B]
MLLTTKLLSLLVYPVSLGLLLLLFSLLSQLRGNRGGAFLWSFLAFALVYFCSTEFGANTLMEPLEARYPAFAPEELPKAEVIVVLGGAIDGESRFGRGGDATHAADRLLTAAELYARKMAPYMLLSGGAPSGQRPEADLMAEKLEFMGVPRSAMLLEPASRTTFDNAVNSADMLNARNYRHILLVTSGAHMRRAVALFEAFGLQVTAVATDHQIPRYAPTVPGWLPTADRLARSTRAVHEWVGYWVYDLTGKF